MMSLVSQAHIPMMSCMGLSYGVQTLLRFPVGLTRNMRSHGELDNNGVAASAISNG